MSIADLEQGRIHYTEAGPSDGRPVVLVHGIFMGADLWAPLVERLAARGLRCIAPTWPMGAHRDPMAPDADLAPRGMAALVAAFLDALDLHDVVLVGNDSGGAVCQVVAAEHPERLGALVLTNCDTFEHFPPKAFRALVLAARRTSTFKAALAPMHTAVARRSPVGFGLLSHGDIDHLARGWVEPLFADERILDDARRFGAGMRPQVTLDAARRLAGFGAPIVLAWGVDDRLFPPSHAQRFAEQVPAARIEPIPGSRTLVMLDQPDRLAEIVAAVAAVPAAALPRARA